MSTEQSSKQEEMPGDILEWLNNKLNSITLGAIPIGAYREGAIAMYRYLSSHQTAPEIPHLDRAEFERRLWEYWEKDGKSQLNMHGYLQGAIAGYSIGRNLLATNSRPAPEPEMKWVKAEKELPVDGGLYVCEIHFKENGAHCIQRRELEYMKGFDHFNGLREGEYVTLWLEELPSTPSTDIEDVLPFPPLL